MFQHHNPFDLQLYKGIIYRPRTFRTFQIDLKKDKG